MPGNKIITLLLLLTLTLPVWTVEAENPPKEPEESLIPSKYRDSIEELVTDIKEGNVRKNIESLRNIFEDNVRVVILTDPDSEYGELLKNTLEKDVESKLIKAGIKTKNLSLNIISVNAYCIPVNFQKTRYACSPNIQFMRPVILQNEPLKLIMATTWQSNPVAIVVSMNKPLHLIRNTITTQIDALIKDCLLAVNKHEN